VPHENDFLFHVRQVGWHLDRGAFDGMLAAGAEARGVRVLRATRVVDAVRAADGWTLSLSSGDELRARFLVDATGAGASLARRAAGARLAMVDRLAGFVRFFRQPGGGSTPHTLVEAFADGWWYTAPLPDGRRVVVCMTDSDLARGLRLDEDAAWHALLRDTAPRVGRALAGAAQDGAPVVRAARSRRLRPAAGDDWLAVGDAASTFDPLSSQGIVKALRSGIFAAYAAGDLLAKGDDAGMRRYRAFVQREFDAYLQSRARYYADEARWPEREFWRRRHAAVPAEAGMTA
jgi:flavin-dependent dehydrogenase